MKNTTALEITDDGIKSQFRKIDLKWIDITDIAYFPGQASNLIGFYLVDVEAYKQASIGGFKKLLNRYHQATYSTPLILPLADIRGTDKLIFQTIREEFDKEKQMTAYHD